MFVNNVQIVQLYMIINFVYKIVQEVIVFHKI